MQRGGVQSKPLCHSLNYRSIFTLGQFQTRGGHDVPGRSPRTLLFELRNGAGEDINIGMYTFWTNITLWCAIAGWLVAQFLKLFTYMIREKRFDFAFLLRLGGMPSSHTASAMACAISVGLRMGFGSSAFALATGLVVLIMVDAQSVRRAAGQQARLLNQMAEEFYKSRHFPQKKLVEFLGHTRLEVFAGAILGAGLALIIHGAFPEWAAIGVGN